ncbi:hypothetical protein K0U00_03250, partial [Paenibacillus sepulcri]|nr:hypothetical protein [Paenibacillus sepulcri]
LLPAVEGDLNQDGNRSVGDLAIAASSIGRTSADPDWGSYAGADVSGDGQVDIADVSEIARWILSGVAEETAAIVLTGPGTARAGDSFDLIYGLSGRKSAITAEDLTLTYNPDQLELTGTEALDAERYAILDHVQSPGGIRFIAVRFGELQSSPSGDFVKLQFKVKPEAASGASAITVTRLIVSDGQGIETSVGSAAHHVTISTSLPGDYNHDGKMGVGDLAVTARFYGRTSEQPDWMEAKDYDLNGDGIVNIQDLAEIAAAIFAG